ncbi:MAG: amidohydrolase family protein [Acidimicrobiales bacterium]|nr:amidohydrolase family protein [Acidimicrobiales bacterium]
MTTRMECPVFDADHHLYETEDAFSRYLPDELAGVFRYVQINGRTKVVVRGMLSDFIPNPTFEVVACPGATADYFAGNNPEGKSLREMIGKPMKAIPAFRTPQDRLQVLDEQGIHSTLVFPTLASLIEVNFLDLPKVTSQLLHAFNRWLLDDWTFDYQGRIFPTPILNPCIVDDAIAELDFILEHGAKVALVRPGPVAGNPHTRSPFLPEYDPFWARVQESGILIALHASDSGYQRYVNDWEGKDIEFSGFTPSTFGLAAMGARPIMDTMFSAICHGMLTRFPDVKLLSVENGGSWVIPTLKALDDVYKKLPQDFSEHPRDTFGRSVWVNPFWEDSLDLLIDEIGAERICFGSDWPHPEGLAEPLSWGSELEGRSDDEVRRIMGGNLWSLLEVSAPA